MSRRRVRLRIPVAMMAVYAAIIVAGEFIPIAPFGPGGGYYHMGYTFCILAPFIFGPWLGALTSFIGGLIAWLVVPPSHCFGFPEIFANEVTWPIYIGLAIYAAYKFKYKIIAAALFLFTIFWRTWLDPFIVFPAIWKTPYVTSGHIYMMYNIGYLPRLICNLLWFTPIGWKYAPQFLQSEDAKKRFIGIALFIFMAAYGSAIEAWDHIFYMLYYVPIEWRTFEYFGYLWFTDPAWMIANSAISFTVMEGLLRAGYLIPQGARYGPQTVSES